MADQAEGSSTVVRNLFGSLQLESGVESDVDLDFPRPLLTGEDDIGLQRRGVERLMLKSPALKHQLAGRKLTEYRPLLVWDNTHTLIPIKAAFMSQKDWVLHSQLDLNYMAELPVWSLNLTKGGWYDDDGGSCFPVSPAFVEDGFACVYALSNAHVTYRVEQASNSGYVSAGLLAGEDAKSGGWPFVIELHGEEDTGAYPTIDPSTTSPPPSPEKQTRSRFHPPSSCPPDEAFTDVQLIRVLLGPASEIGKFQNLRYLVPSSRPSAGLAHKLDVAVGHFPGGATLDNVQSLLGQRLTPLERAAHVLWLNENCLKPLRKSMSFGELISTNSQTVKHTASTAYGSSGGPGMALTKEDGQPEGCPCAFEFVHAAWGADTRERSYNRGVSKDAPFLVCTLADKIIPKFAGHQFADRRQEQSIRGWVKLNRPIIEQAHLWAKVVAAGFG
ncbi:hypothetical protein KFL_012710020 [Klebsormidium nitens]|uniref:Uncharacterized protein n=1 Tax=Klebsormidium nitens TaxID=105231 RepID=A0A1Y1IU05_KLENI|nr:hypothetical protein KFL_012710020 [Klebsormidium nitens]|eukprot:GAQ93049.1 hypothetical protein KFL_012710020 [Klebsormidium nitens]